MGKQAISVTLRPDNLLWLRGQVRAASRRSVSELLDRLISDVRAGAAGRTVAPTSVVGSIDILESDPGLRRADAAIRGLFTGRAHRARRPGTGRTRRRA